MQNGDWSDSLPHLEVFALKTITHDAAVVSNLWFFFHNDLIEYLWFTLSFETPLDDLRDFNYVI